MVDNSSPSGLDLSNKSKPGRKLAIVGAYLQIGLVLGLIGTVIGMMKAFNELGQSGIGDPGQLAASINIMLHATAVGVAFGLTGLILVCIAAFHYDYRTPWVFAFLVIYGVLFCLHFPFGTAIGSVLLFTCINRRQQFFIARTPSPIPESNNPV
jgi:MotA/TolQ/ExbB proton channel family